MKVWSFYDPKTGFFTGQTFGARTDAMLAANTPPGMRAIEGHHDKHCRRVDLASGRVVPYKPPQPDDDHEWRPDIERWEKRADVVEREREAQAARDRVLDLEREQLRATREALLALLPEGKEKQRLRSIETEIEELRPVLRR